MAEVESASRAASPLFSIVQEAEDMRTASLKVNKSVESDTVSICEIDGGVVSAITDESPEKHGNYSHNRNSC